MRRRSTAYTMFWRVGIPALPSLALLSTLALAQATAPRPSAATAPTPASSVEPTQTSPAPSPAPRPKQEIEGVVLGPQGQPIKGALVYTFPPGALTTSILSGPPSFPWRASEYRTAVSGEDGRFVIAYIRRPFNLRAEALPLAPAESLNVAPGAPVVLRLTPGFTQAGRVFHAVTGEPVAGIDVQAIEVTLRMPPGAVEARRPIATTDREGRFLLRGLQRRSHGVSLKSAAFVSAAMTLPFLPGSKEIILNVRPGASWTGVVTDPKGAAVTGAMVSASTAFGGGAASARTDGLGKFSLAVLPGRYTITVTHEDFAPASMEGLSASLGSAENLRVQMKVGATASGRIVDEDGKPLSGRVRLRLFGRALSLFGSQDLGDRTDAAARFNVPHIPAGQHEIDIMASAHGTSTIPVSVALPQGTLDLGDIRLESGLVIAGKAVDDAGEPVQGARVRANASRDASRSQPFEAESETDGRFVISGIKEGRYNLSVSAEGFSILDGLQATSGDRNVTVTLGRTGRVRLLVTQGGASGVVARPVKESVLLVGQRQGSGPSPFMTSPFINRAEQTPSESGELIFENLAAGRQLLEIGATGYLRKSLGVVNVEAGALTDLGQVVLERGLAVRGTVVDSLGRPVRGADVDAPFQEMNRTFPRRTVSDGDGRFEITGTEPGKVELTVSHAAFATSRTTTTIEADGTSPEVAITLRAGGRITGTVKRRGGEPVAGVFVNCTSCLRGSVDWMRAQAETDANGAFALENVAPGGVSVSLFHGQAGRFEATMGAQVVVREGEESTHNFVLRETVVRGRVTGSAARANLRVRLQPRGFGGATYGGGNLGASLPSAIPRGSAFTAADGSFELMVDQTGRYSAEVTSYDGSENLIRREVDVPDVDVFPLDFAVGGSRVMVTVLDQTTRNPVPAAFVGAIPVPATPSAGPSSANGSGSTGSDGRAALYLNDGDYRIAVQSQAHVPTSVTAHVSGETEVTVMLEAGLKISGRVRTTAGVMPPGYYVTAGPIGGGATRSAQRSAGGAFEVNGLRPGRYRIHASAADDFGEAEAEAGTENIEIELRPGGTVSVLVLDASQRPVTGASVAFANERGEPLSGVMYYTAADGRLSMPVPAQRVVVNVGRPGLVGKATVLISPGETAEVSVTLEPRPVK
jgi:hypothetical protein